MASSPPSINVGASSVSGAGGVSKVADRGEYFERRLVKQVEQRREEASDIRVSSLFQGVIAWFNGATSPSNEVLRELLLAGGGETRNDPSAIVTHVVAQTYAAWRIAAHSRMRRPPAVVLPSWIVESSAAGRRLHEPDFALRQLAPPPPSRQFFAPSAVPAAVPAPAAASAAAAAASSPQPALGNGRHAGNDPDFVATFFGQSRLHHIGSWRSDWVSILIERKARRGEAAQAAAALKVGGALTAEPRRETELMGWRRVIAHVDIDCFFAQIALLDRPELRDFPIAVAHGGAHPPQPGQNAASLDVDNDDEEIEGFGGAAASSSADRGNSEISSANYVARRRGIRAGMFVSSAMTLCPGLVVLPYDFERSRVVTRILYSTLLDLSPRVQALSCDEAFVDLSHAVDPLGLLRSMRSSFHKATGCTLSVGVGQSLLVARLATRRAKPDGLAYLPSEGASLTEVFAPLPIEELPGVGPRATSALNEIGIVNIGDALAASRATLVSVLGNTAALAFINAAQGNDDREVITLPPPPKSVGVQMNYGIRLSNVADVERVLSGLAAELARRLRAAGEEEADLAGRERSATGGHIRCKSLTLKVLIRRPGAGEPRKFNGHGIVDSISRSMRPRKPIHESIDIAKSANLLLSALKLDPIELRGLGLVAGDLERPAERTIGSVLRDMVPQNSVAESDDIIEVKEATLPHRGAAKRAGVFSSWIRGGSRPAKLARTTRPPQATVLDSDDDGVVIIDQEEASSAPQRLVPGADKAESLHAWLLRSLNSDPSGKQLEQEAVSALTKRDGMNADDVAVFLRTLSRVGLGEWEEPRKRIAHSLLSSAREKFGFSIMW